MRLCFPETMRQNLQAIFILVLLIVHSYSVIGSDSISPSQKVESEIKSIAINPSLPVVNQDIRVNAVITLNNAEIFNNLTLIYQIDNVSTQVVMSETNTNKYESIIPGQANPNTIFIEIILYTNNSQTDTYTTSLSVLSHPSDRALIQIPLERAVGLNRGNYSLFTENGGLRVNTTVIKPVGFVIRKMHQINISKPDDFTFISEVYEVEFNQTQNIIDSTISLRYNKSQVQQLGSLIDGIRLMTRSNESTEWAPVNTTVFIQNGMIGASVDHFSQWALATADAKVQILPQFAYLRAETNRELNLSFEIKNIGNINAENLTITLYGPTQLLILPSNDNQLLTSLTPLQAINASWVIYPEREAEFNLILRVQGDGLISSQLVKIDTSSDNLDSSSDVHSTTSVTPFQLIIISIMTSFIIIVRLKKYVRLKA